MIWLRQPMVNEIHVMAATVFGPGACMALVCLAGEPERSDAQHVVNTSPFHIRTGSSKQVMSYRKSLAGDKQLKGANGQSPWPVTLCGRSESNHLCGMGGGGSKSTGGKSRAKILWQWFPTGVLGETCATKLAEVACWLPAHPHGHPSPEPSTSAATTGQGCTTGWSPGTAQRGHCV